MENRSLRFGLAFGRTFPAVRVDDLLHRKLRLVRSSPIWAALLYALAFLLAGLEPPGVLP